MSSEEYSSSQPRSDAQASGSSTFSSTHPSPAPAPHLTSAERAQLPWVPTSSSPAASDVQHVSAPGAGERSSQEQFSDSSSPPWEEADEEQHNYIEGCCGDDAGDARSCDDSNGNGSRERNPTSASSASGEPIDAPLMVPAWLPPPPPSSSSSSSLSSSSPAWAAQHTEEGDIGELDAPTNVKSEHRSREGENELVDTRTMHRCSPTASEEPVKSVDPSYAPTPIDDSQQRSPCVAGSPGPHISADQPEEEGHWRGEANEPEEVSDAAVAARAASITSEALEASVWASEERASAALQQFSTALHSKLVEQLIDEAAVAVRRTLQDTVQQHESRVRTLMAHNRVLDRQLSDQSEQMQLIRQDLENSVLRDLQRVLRIDLRLALRSASVGRCDGEESSNEATTPPSASSSRDPSSTHKHHFGAAEDTEGETTAPSVDELIAAYLHQRGILELLHKERAKWRESMAVLRDRLFAATREIVQLRQEVERLQTTTVDVSEHRAVVQANEEAKHQCALMQLQLAKHIEEAEMLEALVERRELTQLQPHSAADGNAAEVAPVAGATAGAAAMDDAALRKGPQWDIALRELEEQATIAANSRPLREQLASAEAQLRSLQKDRDASVAYAAGLKHEGDVLRADLQSMVYRNSVLSQQVASLLVKVERTSCANRQLKATLSTAPQQKGLLNRSGANDKRFLEISASSRTSSPTPLVPSDARLSTLPSQTARRSAWLNAMWPSSTPCVTNPAGEKQASTAVLGSWQPQPSSPLISINASPTTSLMEVEEGVQQRLSTYAASHLVAPQLDNEALPQPSRRPRRVSLRQLGSNTIEVDRVCSPHLPASDHLSGCALGRPPTFSTVDTTCGTVTRQVGTEEVAVRLTQARPPSDHGSPSSSAWRVHSADDVSRDPNLLHLLDTLDKDESLDRFSINSVSELLLRNQELVKQLYEATQRAEAAEQNQKCLSASQRVEATSSSGVVVTSSSSSRYAPAQRSDGTDANLDVPPATLTASTAALLLQAGEQHSRKRNREGDDDDGNRERGDADGARQDSDGPVENKAPKPNATDDLRADATPAAVVESWLTKDASDAVANMVDAIVRRRDVQLTSADTEVSRALLKALEAQRATDNAVQQARADGGDAAGIDLTADTASETDRFALDASMRAMSACLRSLLQLCLRQSAALADVALTAADQHQEIQTVVKNTWTEVQQALLAAFQASRVTFASSTTTSHVDAAPCTPWPPHQRARQEGGGVDSSVGSVGSPVVQSEDYLLREGHTEFRPEEQVALLHQLRTLLHTASKKDATLLHVYQAAQARKDARHHQEKERVTRLLLKLERKRRTIKALQLRNANMDIAAAVGTDSVACGPSQASLLDGEDVQGVVAIGLRASPQSGSPARRTPLVPPMVLPSSRTTDADEEPRGDCAGDRASSLDSASNHPRRSQQQQQHHHHHHDSDNDSDDEFDDETLTLDIFRELQQQLALSQVSYRTAQEELDAEKAKHASLLERMWVLEAARDDSSAAAERLEKRMSEMLSREEYQVAVAELEKTAASLKEREADLRDAKSAHRELQEQVDDLKRQLEMQQRETRQQCGELEDAVRMREQRLLSEESRSRKLHEQLRDVKQYAGDLEKSIALARKEVQDQQELARSRDAMIEELKAQILMRNDVQELLCRLYPDNSVLSANAQLIHNLSDTSTRLQLELEETRQDLAHVREELLQREIGVREAVQERQAAEVRLQDALARLAVLREMDGGDDTVQRNAEETVDAASRMVALFNVDEAPLAALRQRVRYLNACVEAQAKDIAVLRAAESSWKRREVDLRKQLEVMSEDPVSLMARRYGLSTCLSFEAQLGEMQARQDALQKSAAQLQTEKDAIALSIEEHAKAAAVAQSAADEARAVVDRITAQLTSTKEKCATQSSAITLLETEREEEVSKRVEVERRCEQMLTELADTKASLTAAQESMKTTAAQRDHFWRDNNLLIRKVEELEEALLQSDAEKLSAREALAQGLSASAASAFRRRRGGGGSSSAADRYRGQASLTQDLSISSLSDRPS
ncbi:hypothetical protein JKF63_06117 [Porcisia hertigi]|uniref:Uncharacterized protein n=1 Tax=Porcisia hertigi TaxID=2761500 RepID=A0A836LIU6_9TRYP|nr:hypothetical protein JKF63_06117 [Porcisia hertigi]